MSNFYLAHRQGYWDLNALENPILHIWSLAVEEQYYMLFPVALYFAYKKTGSAKIFMKVTLGLFIFFCLTFLIPESAYKTIGIYNTYYLSNLRFPELMLGSFLALLPISKLSENNNRLLSFISLLGLGLCLVFYSREMPLLLKGALLLPCLFTALLIFAMESQGIIKSFLSTKPMVFIGKISYSLYLFHWLFIAWAHYITGDKLLSHNVMIIVVILAFTCSISSYYLLEQPIRRSELSFKQALIMLYIIPSLIVIGYNLVMKKQVNKRDRFTINAEIQLIENKYPAKTAVIGDSHSEHLHYFLNYVGNKEQWNVGWVNIPEKCHIFTDISGNIMPKCEEYVRQLEPYSAVIISMFYNIKRNFGDVPRINPLDFYVENFDQRFTAMVRKLAETKTVYVLSDVPLVNRSPLRAMFLNQYGLGEFLSPLAEMGRTTEGNAHIYNLVKDIPNVEWRDVAKYLPKEYFVEGIPVYKDQDHISDWGSYLMGVEFHKNERFMAQ